MASNNVETPTKQPAQPQVQPQTERPVTPVRLPNNDTVTVKKNDTVPDKFRR
jgi:hypothetical protein